MTLAGTKTLINYIRKSEISRLISINITLAILFGISLLLSHFHFNYLLFIFGFLFFFLPGLNFAFCIEQLQKEKQGIAKIVFWAFLISLIFTPFIAYQTSPFLGGLGTLTSAILVIIILWAISLGAFLIIRHFRKSEITNLNLDFLKSRVLIWSSIILLAIIIECMVIYPFIPEADSYGYIIKVQKLIESQSIYWSEPRILFLSLTRIIHQVSGISLYWLNKLIFPMFTFSFLAVFYKISKSIFKNHKFLKTISTISFLTIPIIVLEMLMPRPQLIYLAILPMFLYLLQDLIITRHKYNIFGIIMLLILSVIAISIHESFLFNSILLVLALIYFYWPSILKKPIQAILIVILIILAIYPWMEKAGLITELNFLLLPLKNVLKEPHFNFWFIDRYKNIDKHYAGWPGFSSLYYYGYTIEILTPILFILFWIKKVKHKIKESIIFKNWIYFASFALFFIIAEGLPRIGLAFHPDRALLLASISISLYLPFLINSISNYFEKRWFKIIMILIILGSLIIPYGITWAKQGWTTKNEYKAAKFIKANIKEPSIFIGQPGMRPMIKYFADQSVVNPTAEFMYGEKLSDDDIYFINNITEYISHKKQYIGKINLLKDKIITLTKTLDPNQKLSKIDAQNQQNLNKLKQTYETIIKYNNRILQIEKEGSDDLKPVYIIYSNDKFSYKYGNRGAWKISNFYGASLEKFTNSPDVFEKIYDQDKVIIFKVRLDKL